MSVMVNLQMLTALVKMNKDDSDSSDSDSGVGLSMKLSGFSKIQRICKGLVR